MPETFLIGKLTNFPFCVFLDLPLVVFHENLIQAVRDTGDHCQGVGGHILPRRPPLPHPLLHQRPEEAQHQPRRRRADRRHREQNPEGGTKPRKLGRAGGNGFQLNRQVCKDERVGTARCT